MSDTTLRVRQIGNYEPYATSAVASDLLLLQRQGAGGPYMAIEAANLVASALAGGQAFGVGFVPPGDANSAIFTRAVSYPLGSGPLWNAYPNGGMRSWMGGTAGRTLFDQTGAFRVQNAPVAAAGGPLATWGDLMAVSPAGALSLPRGTLTVARDPAFAGEVATMGWVGRNTVASFNGRIGRVQLNAEDVYCALGLDPCDPFMTASETDAAICAAIQQLLQTYPAVWSWNGRVGDVWLTTEDINWALAQGGIPPLVPTPGPDAPDNEAANIGWVRDYVAEVLAGPPAYATQDWVTQQLADALTGTVTSFNGRQGVVTLQLADITNAGGAPTVDPSFMGYVSIPTANPGTSNAQAASTAFVMAAVQAATTGVVSFNNRSGAITLTAADISDAGGALLASPNFTGTPTAPTPNAGDSSQRIATTAFVLNEIAEMTAGVSSFNGREGAVTLQLADITGAGGAPLDNAELTGVPTAPTAANGTSTQQLATTAFVENAIGEIDSGVVSFNGRTGAISLSANDVTAAGGLANPSPAITGTPTAPTAAAGTNTTQLATTAFVQNALAQGAVTSLNGRTGAVTLQAADITNVGGALLASPTFTGTPTAPTAAVGTNTTQLATTAFVLAQIAAGGFATAAQLAGYLPLSGGTISGNLQVTGTTFFGGTGQFYAQVGSNGLLINWAPLWYDWFNVSTGLRAWNGNLGTLMTLDGFGNVVVSGTLGASQLNTSGVMSSAAASVAGGLNVGGQATIANVMPPWDNAFSVGVSGSAWAQVATYWLNQQSDPRLKKDLALAPPGALNKVLSVPVKRFHWLTEAATALLHLGWDATDVKAGLPGSSAVRVGDDANHTLGLDVTEMLAWLWQAVQELAAQVKELQSVSAP